MQRILVIVLSPVKAAKNPFGCLGTIVVILFTICVTAFLSDPIISGWLNTHTMQVTSDVLGSNSTYESVSWSPDGRSIAYVNTVGELKILQLQYLELKQVSSQSVTNLSTISPMPLDSLKVRWLSSGTQIAISFNSSLSGIKTYRVDIDGKNFAKVSDSDVDSAESRAVLGVLVHGSDIWSMKGRTYLNSPSGTKALYVSNFTDYRDLFAWKDHSAIYVYVP